MKSTVLCTGSLLAAGLGLTGCGLFQFGSPEYNLDPAIPVDGGYADLVHQYPSYPVDLRPPNDKPALKVWDFTKSEGNEWEMTSGECWNKNTMTAEMTKTDNNNTISCIVQSPSIPLVGMCDRLKASVIHTTGIDEKLSYAVKFANNNKVFFSLNMPQLTAQQMTSAEFQQTPGSASVQVHLDVKTPKGYVVPSTPTKWAISKIELRCE